MSAFLACTLMGFALLWVGLMSQSYRIREASKVMLLTGSVNIEAYNKSIPSSATQHLVGGDSPIGFCDPLDVEQLYQYFSGRRESVSATIMALLVVPVMGLAVLALKPRRAQAS